MTQNLKETITRKDISQIAGNMSRALKKDGYNIGSQKMMDTLVKALGFTSIHEANQKTTSSPKAPIQWEMETKDIWKTEINLVDWRVQEGEEEATRAILPEHRDAKFTIKLHQNGKDSNEFSLIQIEKDEPDPDEPQQEILIDREHNNLRTIFYTQEDADLIAWMLEDGVQAESSFNNFGMLYQSNNDPVRRESLYKRIPGTSALKHEYDLIERIIVEAAESLNIDLENPYNKVPNHKNLKLTGTGEDILFEYYLKTAKLLDLDPYTHPAKIRPLFKEIIDFYLGDKTTNQAKIHTKINYQKSPGHFQDILIPKNIFELNENNVSSVMKFLLNIDDSDIMEYDLNKEYDSYGVRL